MPYNVLKKQLDKQKYAFTSQNSSSHDQSIHERLYKEKDKFEVRRPKQVEEREEEERLKFCTFKPATNRSPRQSPRDEKRAFSEFLKEQDMFNQMIKDKKDRAEQARKDEEKKWFKPKVFAKRNRSFDRSIEKMYLDGKEK